MGVSSPLPKTTRLPEFLRWSWSWSLPAASCLDTTCYQTYGTPMHRQYQLDFGKAIWIEPAESFAPIAYFRKEVYFERSPEQAWLEIAASDNFALIVNGHTVGSLGSVKTYETGIYDMKRALKAGTNVIAVSISRTSYPGSAQLARPMAKSLNPGGKELPVSSPMNLGG